jgi:hypothetical protein
MSNPRKSETFVTMVLTGLFDPITLGIGRLAATSSIFKRTFNSYLSSERYECSEMTLSDPALVERFGLLKRGACNATALLLASLPALRKCFPLYPNNRTPMETILTFG